MAAISLPQNVVRLAIATLMHEIKYMQSYFKETGGYLEIWRERGYSPVSGISPFKKEYIDRRRQSMGNMNSGYWRTRKVGAI